MYVVATYVADSGLLHCFGLIFILKFHTNLTVFVIIKITFLFLNKYEEQE